MADEIEELSVDFFHEVETDVDDNLALEEEEEGSKEETSKKKEEDSEEDLEGIDKEHELEDEDDDDDDDDKDKEGDDENEGEDESEPEFDEDTPLVDIIKHRSGYEIEEEFEDDEEGLQLLTEKIAEKKAEELTQTIFGQYPDVQEYLEYRSMGGDPDKYFQTKFPEVDFNEVEVTEDDVSQQEQLIRRELKQVRGYSEEEIEAEIEDYKNGGILQSKAKRALSALRAKQQKDQDDLLEEQERKLEAQREQVKQHWENVEKTLNETASINGVNIPSKDKQAFFEYLSKPVEDGKSKAMLDHENASLEDRLLIDYLLFKGFKIADLIDKRAKDQTAKTLKERMRKRKLDKKAQKQSKGGESAIEELSTL